MDEDLEIIVPMLVGAAVMLVEEEEDEFEQSMLVVARLAISEITEMEEGVAIDEDDGSWVKVTVNLQEFHMMGSCFKLHFRMSRGVFEALTATIHTHLVQKGRLKRERTPLQDIMLMVIWLLATPESFRATALRFGVLPSTLYYFYSYILEALRELAPKYIQWPDAEERREIAEKFQRATGFPGVIGCIDGTHVFVTAPTRDPANYRNRYLGYSYNVQAIVDSTLLVRDLHVGEPGSMHDARVFRRSPICEKLSQGHGIAPDEHLVGDGAYSITDYMMKPFRNNGQLTPLQLNFNKRLSQSRVRVENAFGRAKMKYRRLKFLHVVREDIAVDHITATFVIHNFGIMQGEGGLDEEELARRIADDLGNINIEEEVRDMGFEDEEDDPRYPRGIEKRLFIMEYLLPPQDV